jgi:hypothetical protein
MDFAAASAALDGGTGFFIFLASTGAGHSFLGSCGTLETATATAKAIISNDKQTIRRTIVLFPLFLIPGVFRLALYWFKDSAIVILQTTQTMLFEG